MSSVTVSRRRRMNEITATSRAHSHTGEKTRSTWVPVIGLRSSFNRSVPAQDSLVREDAILSLIKINNDRT